jgi:hypothetical protein
MQKIITEQKAIRLLGKVTVFCPRFCFGNDFRMKIFSVFFCGHALPFIAPSRSISKTAPLACWCRVSPGLTLAEQLQSSKSASRITFTSQVPSDVVDDNTFGLSSQI